MSKVPPPPLPPPFRGAQVAAKAEKGGNGQSSSIELIEDSSLLEMDGEDTDAGEPDTPVRWHQQVDEEARAQAPRSETLAPLDEGKKKRKQGDEPTALVGRSFGRF